MKAIFSREWKNFFYSPIGYIFTGIFIVLCSFFFINGALMYQSANLNIIFSNINIVYLFLVSILTMGLFSSERARKTDQLLLTSPVSVAGIVAGKFLAALGVFGITLALSLVYPAILMIFGNPSVSEMLGSYIGFILLWSAFISIGMFISSTTESQTIAAVITFGVLLIIYYMNSLIAGIANETVKSVLLWFSLMDRYKVFQTGILDIENILYYLSFIFTFGFLTVQIIRRRQYSDAKLLTNNIVVTAVTIVAIILVNSIVSTVASKVPLKVDLTHDNVYKYSEQTKEVMKNLDKDITIYALYPDDANDTYVNTLGEYLDRYEKMNDKITIAYKDPYKDPSFVRQYGSDIAVGSVIVEHGDRFRVIRFENLYTQSSVNGSTSIDAEKQLTSAIRYVSGMSEAVNVYFIKGHNEHAGSDSALASAFKNEGYSVGDIVIGTDSIPEDSDLLVSLAPAADFSAEERDALDTYLIGGGKAAFAFTAGTEPMERLYSYLGEWGITPNNDFVVESDSSMAFKTQTGAPVPAPKMQPHTITEKLLSGDIALITPAASSVSVSDNNAQAAKVTSLLMTSEASWGITDTSRSMDKKDGDLTGPLTVAALSEKSGAGKIFVIGSVQAIEWQGILDNSSYANGDFILNAFSYMTDKGDALNIRAKEISTESLTMSEQQFNFSVVLVQYVMPLLILAIGLLVWLKRRYL